MVSPDADSSLAPWGPQRTWWAISRLRWAGYVRAVRHDACMAAIPDQTQREPARALRPRDLFDEQSNGDPVSVTMRATSVVIRATEAGKPWAVLEGLWRGHRLRCLVAPTKWAAVEHPANGDGVIVSGRLRVCQGQAVVWVHSLTSIALT